MLNLILQLVFNEFNGVFIDNRQESKLVSEVSKVCCILEYNYKNLRPIVSHKWFLKRGDLLYLTFFFIYTNAVQGAQSPEGMKFSDFPDYDKILMRVHDSSGGFGGMLPQKIFKIRMLKLAENEFHTTKFPDFSLCIEIP